MRQEFLYFRLLSAHTKHRSEQIIVRIAILSFLLHLLLIFFVDFHWVDLPDPSRLLSDPITAIYTPFSFILVYEVYLVVYYLPKSITTYIGKQYEIITLIIIRRIFKDISNLELTGDWFSVKYNIQFTFDILATIILFFLILVFYRLNKQRENWQKPSLPPTSAMEKFIRRKKLIAILLVPIFLLLAVFVFGRWVYESFFSIDQIVDSLRNVNNIFFNEFFTILILTDVLLLLTSFFHTDQFSTVIRNSGFLISTILIRLSFGAEGWLNVTLIIVAVLFGVLILAIHNQYEKLDQSTTKEES